MIEVLLAMMILSMALLPLFLALEVTVLSAMRSQMVTMATNLLQSRAETIKFLGIYSVGSGTTVEPSYKGTPFTLQIEVSDVIGMADVRRFVLKAFRQPVAVDALPVASLEFVLYEGGL